MIFDIEADGLLDRATKIHVMAYEEGGEVKHTHDYDKMRELFLSATVLVGHNIVCYDIPLVEKILGIKVSAKLVDTLGLSWVLRPKRIKHGLEGYGEDYGVPKPEIDNWENLSPEEYAHRCVEDVKINKLLAKDLFSELANLYGTEIENRKRFVEYITFKLHCLRKAEESKFKLDIERCEANLAKIIPMLEEKIAQLTEVMPKVAILAKRSLPAKPYKKDGTLSATGAKWFKLLKDEGLPEDPQG